MMICFRIAMSLPFMSNLGIPALAMLSGLPSMLGSLEASAISGHDGELHILPHRTNQKSNENEGVAGLAKSHSKLHVPVVRRETRETYRSEINLHAHDVQSNSNTRTDGNQHGMPTSSAAAQMAAEMDGRFELIHRSGQPLPTEPAVFSQLELGVVGYFRSFVHDASASMLAAVVSRFRSFLRNNSAGTLAAVAIVAFMLGIGCAFVIASLFRTGSAGACTSTFVFLEEFSATFSHAMSETVTQSLNLEAVDTPSTTLALLEDQFDFETQDETKDQKIHRWQWCKPDDIEQLGLLTQAPAKSFQGYHRIDVAATDKAVQEVLSSSGVDFTAFSLQRNAEDLVWKLLRYEAYFMMIHAGKPSQHVLLMMETVRLRWQYSGRVLVEKPDQTFFATVMNLPAHVKHSGDSPINTAIQMWQEVFMLPPCLASFVQDSIEDKEIGGYNGLRCVERCHIIDVKLKSMPDTDAIKRVGLPRHEDFSSSVGNARDGGKTARNFQWMTLDECADKNVMVNDLGGPSIMDLDSLDGSTAKAAALKLRKFLEHAGVDVDASAWQDRSRSGVSKLEALAKEVSLGECYITNTSSGLHRCVSLVALRVWSPDRQLMLIEKGHKYRSGEEKWVPRFAGASKDCSENLEEAAMRVCERQLGFTNEHVSFGDDSAWEYYEYVEMSTKYTGLFTQYQKFLVDVYLDDDDELWQRVGPRRSRFTAQSATGGFSS